MVLFGQSAGATDVYSVATLPQAPSLINSAIVESVALATLTTNSTIQMTGASFAQTLNCSVDDVSGQSSLSTYADVNLDIETMPPIQVC